MTRMSPEEYEREHRGCRKDIARLQAEAARLRANAAARINQMDDLTDAFANAVADLREDRQEVIASRADIANVRGHWQTAVVQVNRLEKQNTALRTEIQQVSMELRREREWRQRAEAQVRAFKSIVEGETDA